MTELDPPFEPQSSHWGPFRARSVGSPSRLEVTPHEIDPAPTPLIQNLPGAVRHRSRIDRPYVRRGFLEGSPRTGDRTRGRDSYVPIDWAEAEAIAARELRSVYDEFGASAVFGGSYGWASAGRFHHAQSQVHRFLNLLGGYTKSVTNYSLGAALVVVPHVVGSNGSMLDVGSTWSDLTASCELVVAFGGISTKNAAVSPGGPSRHLARASVQALAAAGCRMINVSPLRSDLPDAPIPIWFDVKPGTDVALMLGLAHAIITSGRVDCGFLETYTVGYDRLEAYILGASDGVAKSATWAADICGITEDRIRWLASEMSSHRTFISVAPALQRADYGEQPIWMGVALAALLGGIGLPGQGFGVGLGAMARYGNRHNLYRLPSFPQGTNSCTEFIPVARITEMLENPGGAYEFNGERRHYPSIELVYWAGGNPFHHHQDLFRLHEAFQKPQTVIVQESFWTATAKHADLVLPATMSVERDDFAAATTEPDLVAMKAVMQPYGQSRDDHAIFAAIAARLGVAEEFTEGRTALQWVETLYEQFRSQLAADDVALPDFAEFWQEGRADVPLDETPHSWLDWYREDPVGRPLDTPSGRIELFSDTIAGFGYDDCPGHPAWLPPRDGPESRARYPLMLISNQPATRLHSQLDMGATSAASKVRGREQVTIHPSDAAERGVSALDTVIVTSGSGGFVAVAAVNDSVRPGAIQVATGAWFDPDYEARLCLHGNPNAVTVDRGTSRLAQGSTGQLCRVDVALYTAPVRPVRAHEPAEVSRFGPADVSRFAREGSPG